MAVRDHHRLPLPVRAADDRPVACWSPVLQTAWFRTGNERYLRLTKFWGKLFLINFAMGVVTGIVQEFQFGMNWSDYSPLRRRHLRRPAGHRGAARVLPRVHLPRPVDLRLGPAAQAGRTWPCIWLAAIGTILSAYFILAANSWMQHPVGYRINADTRPRRADRLPGGADQHDRPGHLPAHHHRRLPDRRRRWSSRHRPPGTWSADRDAADTERRTASAAPSSAPGGPGRRRAAASLSPATSRARS